MMVWPLKHMCMHIVSEMSNAHVHMLPKYLACSVYVQKDVKVMDWALFKALR